MTVFEIALVPQQPRQLTRYVLQITTLLYLYQAELSRVPGIRCGDIGQLANGRQCLQPATASWTRAEDFVRFYQLFVWPQARRRRGHAVLHHLSAIYAYQPLLIRY